MKAFCENCQVIHTGAWLAAHDFVVHPENGWIQIGAHTEKHTLKTLRETGKFDSKRLQIHELDVLRYHNPKKPNKNQPLHVVVWSEKRSAFVLKNKKSTNGITEGFSKHSDRWTIIGNATTHSRLLDLNF